MSAIPLRLQLSRLLCCAALICPLSVLTCAQVVRNAAQARAVAARFAPIFYQGIGEDPRADFITNFDFDGDWRGDNNWAHTADARYPLRAYAYYAVSETRTHLFIHYALFHPRDYKGGATRGRILSDIINEGVHAGGDIVPNDIAMEATVAHENDMEGCLVVVEKEGNDLANAQIIYVETLAHNRFQRYAAHATEGGPPTLVFEGYRPRLYVEPKGHGIEDYAPVGEPFEEGNKKQYARKLLRYIYTGRADAPTANSETANYDLLPILTTLWPRARKGVNETYGAKTDYGRVTVSVALANGRAQTRTVNMGVLGSAFLGQVGGHNMARPPWGWFDVKERDAEAGAWFFDPAVTIKRHFKLGDDFSVAYTWQPFLGVGATR